MAKTKPSDHGVYCCITPGVRDKPDPNCPGFWEVLARMAFPPVIKVEGVLTQEKADAIKARYFGTGATRDTDDGKLDYEGFYSPLVMQRYAEYMHKHRLQSDGQVRSADTWQKGMPRNQYIKSLFRHFMDLWHAHRGTGQQRDSVEEALCAIIFNAQGYLLEVLLDREVEDSC